MIHHRRPHQNEAIADILAGFKRHDRGQYISACGTGKTLTSLWVKEDLDAQRTLVLVPSLALVDQFASEWRQHQAQDRPYATLCACSDNTVGQVDEEDDALNFTTDDLRHDGFEVTSSPEHIAAFMRQGGRQVIFSTYQSLHQIEEVQADEAAPSFDLVIADEAHRCAGKRDSNFAIILDEGRIRAARRLFATATPKIQKIQRSGDNEVENVSDMSNESIFGKVFHKLTLGSAINRGILSDYRVVITQVDDPGLHNELNSDKSDESAKVRRRRAVQVSMLKTIREYGLQRVVTFHNRILDAKLYADELPAVAAAVAKGGRPAVAAGNSDYISGKMSAEVRKQKMAAFRENGDGTCHVLSNARCLSEGVDVPDIDGIVFVDPRSSEIEIVQALGRAIRKHESKEYGTIVVPVFVGKGQSPADAIERSSFKHVVDVFNALRAHDMEFGAALDAARQRQANGEAIEGDADPFTKIKFDLKDLSDFDRVLSPLLLESLTDSFWEKLARIRAFFEEHGHCRVPEGYKCPDGYSLYSAMNNMRHSKRSGTLTMTPEQIAELDKMGFEWEPSAAISAAANAEKLAHFRAFFEEHGHCRMPKGYKCPDGYSLYNTQVNMRARKRSGTLTMTPEQIAELDKMGFEWEPSAAANAEKLAHFRAFFEEHGHCRVPEGYKCPDGYSLHSTMNNMRPSKRSGTLTMTPEQLAELDKMGFEWEPRKKQQQDPPTISISGLADRLKNEEPDDYLPEQMAQFGCDPEQSRALIEAGSYDEALELLEEATGESLKMRM